MIKFSGTDRPKMIQSAVHSYENVTMLKIETLKTKNKH